MMVLYNRMGIIANQQGMLTKYLVIGLGINAGLNLLLVPYLGSEGVAMVRVVSNGLFLRCLYGLFFYLIYPFRAEAIWIRPLVASMIMGMALSFMAEWSA